MEVRVYLCVPTFRYMCEGVIVYVCMSVSYVNSVHPTEVSVLMRASLQLWCFTGHVKHIM